MNGPIDNLVLSLPRGIGASARAAATVRHVVWSVVGSHVVHGAILTLACVLPASAARFLTSAIPMNPPQGESAVEIQAAFLSASSAPAEPEREVGEPVQLAAGAPPDAEALDQPPAHAPLPRVLEMAPRERMRAPQSTLDSLTDSLAEAHKPPPEPAIPSGKKHAETREVLEIAERSGEAIPVVKKLSAEPPSTSSQAAVMQAARDQGFKVDSLPDVAFEAEAIYPPELLAQRIQPRAVLRIKIAADGTVTSAAIHRTSGYASADEALLAAVKQWKFKPAMRGGKAVELEILKPFQFRIEDLTQRR